MLKKEGAMRAHIDNSMAIQDAEPELTDEIVNEENMVV